MPVAKTIQAGRKIKTWLAVLDAWLPVNPAVLV